MFENKLSYALQQDQEDPLGEMENETQSSYPGKILDLACEQNILTNVECDAIWNDNVLQWLFGEDDKGKGNLVTKILG